REVPRRRRGPARPRRPLPREVSRSFQVLGRPRHARQPRDVHHHAGAGEELGLELGLSARAAPRPPRSAPLPRPLATTASPPGAETDRRGGGRTAVPCPRGG